MKSFRRHAKPRHPSALARAAASLPEARLSIPDALVGMQVEVVSTDVGTMFLHANDQVMTPWIRHYKSWEPDEGAFLRKVIRSGDVVVDIGANIGYFTLLAASLVGSTGRVIAVEPDPANLALLRANLWANGVTNATVLPMAAAERQGFLAFRHDPENYGNHQAHANGDADIHVPCGPVAAMIGSETRADVVKVDVQGMDHEALLGVLDLIDENTQCLVEFWLEGMEARSVDPQEVLNGYHSAGFDLAILDSGGAAVVADRDQILQAASEASDRFVNLIMQRTHA